MHGPWQIVMMLSLSTCAVALGQTDQIGQPEARVAQPADAQTVTGRPKAPAATMGAQRLAGEREPYVEK